MAEVDNELRTLRSALRVLEEKNRRTGGDGYPLQIAQLKHLIVEKEANHHPRIDVGITPPKP
ncbi:hypothetical protein [Pararhizobium sp. O133]|uniref:hypothetical protein n=1 Tax=Pararhizobium sp. O133 TaxID=3449278 RepID=UPI003F688984